MLADIAASGSFEKIVLRPHPSENHDAWREWAGPLGIDVRFEGSANTWLLAAQAILHTGCTTGIEGVLLDRPVASFVPDPDHEMLNQADEVSVHIATADEFLAHAAAWRPLGEKNPGHLKPEQQTKLESFIANVDPPMSVDRILDALDRLDLPEVAVEALQQSRENPKATRPQKSLLSRLFSRIRLSAVVQKRPGTHSHQKFPDTELSEITAPIETWVAAGVLKRVPEVSLSTGRKTWLVS